MTEVDGGTVENHGRERVEFEMFTGMAGVRRDGDLIEVAFVGELPRRGSPVGQVGMIGVDRCEIVKAGRSPIARGLVSLSARKL